MRSLTLAGAFPSQSLSICSHFNTIHGTMLNLLSSLTLSSLTTLSFSPTIDGGKALFHAATTTRTGHIEAPIPSHGSTQIPIPFLKRVRAAEESCNSARRLQKWLLWEPDRLHLILRRGRTCADLIYRKIQGRFMDAYRPTPSPRTVHATIRNSASSRDLRSNMKQLI